MEFLDQAGFSQSRLAHDDHQLTVALPRSLPAPHQHRDLFLATYQRREMALPCAASGAACPNDPIKRHRLCHALQFMAAALLGDEQPGDLALNPRRHHNGTRIGQRLCSRRSLTFPYQRNSC